MTELEFLVLYNQYLIDTDLNDYTLLGTRVFISPSDYESLKGNCGQKIKLINGELFFRDYSILENVDVPTGTLKVK